MFYLSSIGVYIVDTEDAYKEAIEKSFTYEDEVVMTHEMLKYKLTKNRKRSIFLLLIYVIF